MPQEHARIVDAMIELKERRDAGELVNDLLQEVADHHRVPLGALKERAEASWGTPLETDCERHAAHFEQLALKLDVEKHARLFAKQIWELNLDYLREFSYARINWSHEIDSRLTELEWDDPRLVEAARLSFMEESKRFETLRQAGFLRHA